MFSQVVKHFLRANLNLEKKFISERMSLLPALFHSRDFFDPFEFMYPTRRRYWDDFGLGVTIPEIQMFSELPMRQLWRKELGALRKGDLIPHVGKDGFQVSMDVQQFLPNEITVKTIENTVVVEGKHEDREDDHGVVSRHFVRKYSLPQGYDPSDIHTTLSSDGYLTIKAPPPSKELAGKERIIEIQQTGPAHLHLKENVSKEEKQKDVDATTNG